MTENSPHQGTIPFKLYIVPLDLIIVFLCVGSVQITCRDLPTRFSSFFLYDCYIVKIDEISDSSIKKITSIIRKYVKNCI